MSTLSLLEQERLRRGWSRPMIEEKTNGRVTLWSLERWEKGKTRPNAQGLEAICKLYDKTPRELGFEQNHAIMGSITKTIDALEEGIPIMSGIIRRAVLGNLSSRLTGLIDLWPRRDYRYSELQGAIHKAIFDHHVIVQQDNEAVISRREALQSMALVPIQLSGGIAIVQSGKIQKTDTDVFLKHCAAGITACWYLRRGYDLNFVSDLISTYIALLQPLTLTQSEAHRKAAATLLSQSFMLKSHLGSEDELVFAERAIYYSDLSQDPTTQSLAYRRRAYEYWDTKNNKDALLDAEKGYGLARSKKDIHPIIHSITAATLSLCQAANGKIDDAKICIAEARTLFDPSVPIPSMSYTESILTAISGGVHRQIGLWGEATALYEQSLDIPDISALGYAEQRINYAKTEVSRDDQPRNMDLCIKLLTEAVTRAEELDSKSLYKRASEVYDMLRLAWPLEELVKKLGREHFGR